MRDYLYINIVVTNVEENIDYGRIYIVIKNSIKNYET